MMRMWIRVLGTTVVAWGVGCSSSSSDEQNGGPTGLDAGSALELTVACTDALDGIYSDPGPVAGDKGTILKCARDRDFTKDELEKLARASNYRGRPFTSGARVYRVTYVTERATVPPSPGYSSALVLIPDTPRAANLPVVVASHGTVGQAGKCTVSKQALTPPGNEASLQFLPLVGDGYAVIAPDYAGYANYGAPGNPAPGYALSEDEGKSVLDGARALRKLVPRGVGPEVVITGHSQGGHAALSALALSDTYGAGGTLAGVVAYSPLWFNQAAWSAILLLANQYPIAQNRFIVSVGLWYYYSHGEVQDGPGRGVDVFAADKRDRVKAFFDNVCLRDDTGALDAFGTTITDLYDPTFAAAVKEVAALGGDCPASEPRKAICEKWRARHAADRPHITGAAARVPVLVVYGSADTTIPPERATCGFTRLKAVDGANARVCLLRGENHSSIIGVKSDYVNDWIAARALGGAEPAPCAEDETGLRDETSAPVRCAVPPPND